MGKKADEIAALRKQVEALQAEVAALRAVPWWQQQGGGVATWPPPSPQCTCGTSARCMKHFPADWGTIWVNSPTMCAGAAPAPQTYIYNTAGAAPSVIPSLDQQMLTAGCAQPGPVLTLNLPSGQ